MPTLTVLTAAMQVLDSRVKHLELNWLPTSWNPFAGKSEEEKAAFDELRADIDTMHPTVSSLKDNIRVLAKAM